MTLASLLRRIADRLDPPKPVNPYGATSISEHIRATEAREKLTAYQRRLKAGKP